jgi:tripartite-type tricarboxylate transporter receptor subunit TctC
MNYCRRRFLHFVTGAASLSVAPRLAGAQIYPSRPVTMIVPFAAGGPSDVAARIVSEHMSRTPGQQFVIKNVLGAGGTIGSMRAMRANPDGYTIQMGHLGTHATSVSLYPNLAYTIQPSRTYRRQRRRGCRASTRRRGGDCLRPRAPRAQLSIG